VVQIGNYVSNTTVIPVANGSRNCTFSDPALASLNFDQTTLPVNTGSFKFAHFSDGNGTFDDEAKSRFQQVKGLSAGTQPFLASWLDDQPPGTCYVFNNFNENGTNPITAAVALDAGARFTVTGPNGNVTLGNNQKTSEFNAKGTFLVPGA